MESRKITEPERAKMERLSLAILDLCDKASSDGLDAVLVLNAAVIGLASVVGATISETATQHEIEQRAAYAGAIVAREVTSSFARFKRALKDAATATRN